MTVTSQAPDRPLSRRRNRPRRSRNLALLAIAWGVIGILLSLSLPFAPVLSDRTTVDWGGAEVARSTTAFFVPYRPADLAVDIPCAAVRAGAATPAQQTIFATAVGTNGAQSAGLVVQGADRTVRVLVNGRAVLEQPVPAGDCELTVAAGANGLTGTLGATTFQLPGEPVPDVYAFVTDLSATESAGLAATVHTHSWFESRPTAIKLLLLVASATFALGSVLLLHLLVTRTRRRLEPTSPESTGPESTTATTPVAPAPRRRLPLLADLGVFGALIAWGFAGPQTADDGYSTMTVRNAGDAGDIGNYYHWFNASEAPFTLVQQIARPLVEVSVAPVWLRLPSLLLAAATWLVLTRGILPTVSPRVAGSLAVRAVAAGVFLAWWLPFNIGMRPEPYIAFLSALTLWMLLRGTADTVRNPGLWFGGAALSAGLAITVTPSFVVALAPVVAFLPRMWRTLQPDFDVRARAGWTTLTAQVALFGSIAAVALPIIFADQSLSGVRRATDLHRDIGPNLHWYQEYERYSLLLSHSDQGTAMKRLAVLVTAALLITVVLSLVRRPPARSAIPALTASIGLAYLMLWLTPSKWSHHFGSLAGLAVPFVVIGAVHLYGVARSHAAEPGVRRISLLGGLATALAAGLAYSGPNLWYGYSVLGVPWLDGPIRPLGVPIDNPACWLVAAAGLVGVLWWRRERHPQRWAVALATVPAGITVVALSLGAVLLLGSFALATVRQVDNDGFSFAEANIGHVLESDCGMPDKVSVYDGTDRPLVSSAGADEADGFVLDGGLPPGPADVRPPALDATAPFWGSWQTGDADTGLVRTRWFDVPRTGSFDDIAVSAAGMFGGPNVVSLEFGAATGRDTTPLGSRAPLTSPALDPIWQEMWVRASDVPPGADRVRVVATDVSTGVGGWLAVSAPRARTAELLTAATGRTGPVIVDWPMAWWFPCVEDTPVVANGLAEAPRMRIAYPKGYEGPGGISYEPSQGGSFAGLRYTGATQREISSTLAGSPGFEWGHLMALDYPGLAVDEYRVTHDEVRVGGNEGDE